MRVLVLGTGGEAKRPFLERLQNEAAEVVAIDCPRSAPSTYPAGVQSIQLPSLGRASLEGLVPRLAGSAPFDAITTIFEPCVDSAAFLRSRLNVRGLQHDASLTFRDKWRMYEAADSLGLRMPRSTLLTGGRAALPPTDSGQWVIKPTRASGNLGVRIVTTPDELEQQFRGAREDTARYQLEKGYYFSDMSTSWVACEYIEGIEIEVDLLVSDGEVGFFGLHEKTLITRYGNRLQEDNALTPPLRLSAAQVAAIRAQCENVARRAHELYFAPAGARSFVLYLEFRLRAGGGLFCLEIAQRIGGGWVPLSLRRSLGVDTFQLAATAALDRKFVATALHSPARAVYWQLLYATVPGILLRLEGTQELTAEEILHVEPWGFAISTPSTQFVACIMVVGHDPAQVSELARNKLAAVRIAVQMADGSVDSNSVPLPPVS